MISRNVSEMLFYLQCEVSVLESAPAAHLGKTKATERCKTIEMQ